MRARRLVPLLTALLLILAVAGTTAAHGGRPFTVQLLGANERPTAGDPDGSGTAWLTINPGLGEVCWSIEWTGIAAPVAAHIHTGTADTFGGVVVPLLPVAGGCTTAGRELLVAIMRAPEAYYVNVHNADFPAGALRGQLR